jgi:hypothetical protein
MYLMLLLVQVEDDPLQRKIASRSTRNSKRTWVSHLPRSCHLVGAVWEEPDDAFCDFRTKKMKANTAAIKTNASR